MKFVTVILNFIVDFIKAVVLFLIISIGIFILVVGILSSWLYYKYAKAVKTYKICVYRAKGVDVQQYIESQSFLVKPGINEVTIDLRYDMILDPIIDQLQRIKIPSALSNPLNSIGNIEALTIGKIMGVDKPKPVACVKRLSNDSIEIFAGYSWYLWGSTKVTKKLLPTRLELTNFKLYTFKIPEDYLRYIFEGEVNTTIELSGKSVAPADVVFNNTTVSLKYKVSDLLVK